MNFDDDIKILELELLLENERGKNIALSRKLLNREIELGNLIPLQKKQKNQNIKLETELATLHSNSVKKNEFKEFIEKLSSFLKIQYKKSQDETERLAFQNFIEMLRKMSS